MLGERKAEFECDDDLAGGWGAPSGFAGGRGSPGVIHFGNRVRWERQYGAVSRLPRVLAIWTASALVLVGGLVWCCLRYCGPETVLACYGTSLRGRTPNQVFNAARAAHSLHGVVLQPGEVLSFNRRVGPWNAATGYRKAPASFDGELARLYGGGVCQTSTTLYNAALLAGLEIVERHRHVRPPKYVIPGRDAAVAFPRIDLRVRNPYPFPVRFEARVLGQNLTVLVRGRGPRRPVTIRTEVTGITTLPRTRAGHTGRSGQPGFTATTYCQVGNQARVASHQAYAPVCGLQP